MTQILIVEDEDRISSFVEKGLRANGYATIAVRHPDDAVAIALEEGIDLMILDLGLPDRDGLLLLEELRGQGFTAPIIILTARDDIDDKVTGFEMGADDYITKPFRLEELLVRIRARLRTSSAPASANSTAGDDLILKRGAITLDLRTRRIKINGELLELSAREFTLVETFMRHPDQVMSREQLLDRVWGYDYAPGSNIVDVYVGYLRKKLGSDVIETVRGTGYRMPNC
ncbi:MAG: response regulator transcription factor [Leptolyngbyaceae bacterium]|nr:response regulator transcription factor [Leptolyngbyaceae bacterium]